MILDAINRISFSNSRRSKGFQVNCGKPDFVNILSKFKFAVHFAVHFVIHFAVHFPQNKFNHSMTIQNYCFYLYSHFVNFDNIQGYLLFTIWVFIGTDWAIRHAVCVWCRYAGVWMYVSQKMRHNFRSQLHYMVQKTLRTLVEGDWGNCITEENQLNVLLWSVPLRWSLKRCQR